MTKQAIPRFCITRATRAACALITLLAVTSSHAQTISPPSVQLVDEFGVNLMNGQVNQSLPTVSIGGSMGISHDISLYTNHFFPLRKYGYHDKFNGAARYVQMGTPTVAAAVMRVFDFTGSADFKVFVNGVVYAGPGPGATQNYEYVALRDGRDRLKVAGNSREFLDWTKADGTVSRFHRGTDAPVAAEGRLVQVTYPNGFTINVDWPTSVSTNTGFTIVYQYQSDSRPVPNCDSNQAGAPPASVAEWTSRNPRYVKAVNGAVCPATNSACLAKSWPTATFTWPAGMPRLMYCGESVFEVQTPVGTTTFRYKPYDLAYNGTTVVQGYTPGLKISPRLFKVKPASSTVESIEYTYKNLFQVYTVGVREDVIFTQFTPGTFPTEMGSYEFLVQESGAILTAKFIDRTNSYDLGSMYMGDGYAQNNGTVAGGISRVVHNVSGIPTNISTVDGKHALVQYEPTIRNFPQTVSHHNGLTEVYTYTSGNNVGEIKAAGVSMSRAEYPWESSCDSSPKTCNRPKFIFDANNNATEYEYHSASGQVSRIIPSC